VQLRKIRSWVPGPPAGGGGTRRGDPGPPGGPFRKTAAGNSRGMADTSEAAAELRLSRIKSLSEHDLVALLTYLLARYPDSFPELLDDALNTISPGQASRPAAADVARTPMVAGVSIRPVWIAS